MIRNKVRFILLTSIIYIQLPLNAFSMNEEEKDPPQKGITVRKGIPDHRLLHNYQPQLIDTVTDTVFPGIQITVSTNKPAIIRFEDNVSESSQRGLAISIKNGNGLDFFRKKGVKFYGLTDLFVQEAFPTLLQNKVRCIVSYCKKDSPLDQLLANYYLQQQMNISVYIDDENTYTDWLERAQEEAIANMPTVVTEFDFSLDNYSDYNEYGKKDFKDTIDYLREHPNP